MTENGTAFSSRSPASSPPFSLPFSSEEDWSRAFESAEIAFHKAFFMTSYFEDLPRGHYSALARRVAVEIATAVIKSMHLDDEDIGSMPGVTIERM